MPTPTWTWHRARYRTNFMMKKPKTNYKNSFKRFSANIQFIAALLALPGYFISALKLIANISWEPANKTVEYNIPLYRYLGPYYNFVLFISVYITVFILWNIVIIKIGQLVRFVKWSKIYRWGSYALLFLLLMTGCEITYKLFWGGSFIWHNNNIYVILKHHPWCIFYSLISILIGAFTIYRLIVVLEESYKEKHKLKYSFEVWNQRW